MKYFDEAINPENISEEVESLLNHIQTLLLENDLTFKNVTKVVMYIRKMSTFIKINEVYKEFFKFKPPTRV